MKNSEIENYQASSLETIIDCLLSDKDKSRLELNVFDRTEVHYQERLLFVVSPTKRCDLQAYVFTQSTTNLNQI